MFARLSKLAAYSDYPENLSREYWVVPKEERKSEKLKEHELVNKNIDSALKWSLAGGALLGLKAKPLGIGALGIAGVKALNAAKHKYRESNASPYPTVVPLPQTVKVIGAPITNVEY